jgi:hypothetical protein
MRRTFPALIAACTFLAMPVLATAQDSEPIHGPDWRAPQRITPQYFSPKPDAPFSATAVTLWVRTLPDGSTVSSQNSRQVARDTDGRIYQQRATFVPLPKTANAESRVYATDYDDPIEHKWYHCMPAIKICNLFGYYVPANMAIVPTGLQPDKTSFITREDLGSETLAGLEVQHSRETTTVYSGAVGNTRTILRTCEYWYSSALGINIKVKRQDPRDGDQTLWLKDVSLSEPEPLKFKIPADYRIVDHRHPEAQDQVQADDSQ